MKVGNIVKSYIEEATKDEAEKLARYFYEKGIIKSYGLAQQFLHHTGRGIHKEKKFYHWRIECEE